MENKTLKIELTGEEITSLIYQLRPAAIKQESPKLREKLKVLQIKLSKLLDTPAKE